MKLHFEPKLDYQLQAIDAVCDLFRGQEICRTEFTVAHPGLHGQPTLGMAESDLGIGNNLSITNDTLLKNLQTVQLRNEMDASPALESGDFTVEMETGTGKTYVYLRTIFELNKRYGFTKFVIVVPSIAVKEGVYKTLQMTAEHFRAMYAGVPSEYFLYDSSKLGQVRNFATSASVQIMVVTVGAINKKDVNNLYKKDSEKTFDERPVDLIRATHPIVIVDEPQSVDGGLKGAGKIALEAMGPLCTLRYSATHVNQHHMVYRLDAVDAYQRRLVKQIEIASAVVENAHNKPFVRLISVGSRRGDISAKILIDIKRSGGVQREEAIVRDGDDLEELSGRALYADCHIGELRAGRGAESMELRVPGGEHDLVPGEAWGDIDPLAVQRHLIRRTIREHLDKDVRLRPRGIKVLSLFFIDSVERYRRYDDSGNAVKGPYAQIFEEEYRIASKRAEYYSLFNGPAVSVDELHNGYFSIDKKDRWTDTDEASQADRNNAQRAYELIMKEKEKLLSFETPLAFIFSHSALKEGWDNPNVFQICTLRDIQSERERRQTIGRGLRLCVDQSGTRIRGFDTNTLTVVATEKYEQFAAGLQKEIEEATGTRLDGARVEIRNADERLPVKPQRSVLLSPEFRALWDQVKYESTYRVAFDTNQLIADCARELHDSPEVAPAILKWRKADITIGRGGVKAIDKPSAGSAKLHETGVELPDILTELQQRTQLTRKTVQRVLTESGRLSDFRKNPQQFIDLAASVINRCKRKTIVGGIQYQRLGDDRFYAQELLDQETLGYIRHMLADSRKKTPYEFIVYDSEIEKEFADRMEKDADVKVFVKLPPSFKIPTPLGAYTPDWAVLMEIEGRERLYFVVETKGSVASEDLRESESAKIACGRAHFKAMRVKEPAADYIVAETYDDLLTAAAARTA